MQHGAAMATHNKSTMRILPVSTSISISAKLVVRPGVTPTRGRLSLATPISPDPAIMPRPSLVTGLMSFGASLPEYFPPSSTAFRAASA